MKIRQPIQGSDEGWAWSNLDGLAKAHFFPTGSMLSLCEKKVVAASKARYRAERDEACRACWAAHRRRERHVEQLPVVLVGCCKEKRPRAIAAKELYRSTLFQLARTYAEARKLPWAILSAKHGLVLPDEVVEPYDMSAQALRAQGARATEQWATLTAAQIERSFPRASFVFLAGSSYRVALDHLPRRWVSEPLAGLGIGQRLSWLKRENGLAVGATS